MDLAKTRPSGRLALTFWLYPLPFVIRGALSPELFPWLMLLGAPLLMALVMGRRRPSDPETTERRKTPAPDSSLLLGMSALAAFLLPVELVGFAWGLGWWVLARRHATVPGLRSAALGFTLIGGGLLLERLDPTLLQGLYAATIAGVLPTVDASGPWIQWPGDAVHVAPECVALRTWIVFVTWTWIVGGLWGLPAGRFSLLVGLGGLVALLANWVRILALVGLALENGSDRLFTSWHDGIGILCFVPAFAAVALVASWLRETPRGVVFPRDLPLPNQPLSRSRARW